MEKRKNFVLIASIILAVLATVCAFRFPRIQHDISHSGIYDESGTELTPNEVHELPRAMLFSTTEESAEITVKATVKPENAYDKRVDWSVKWVNSEEIGDVNQYLTVTPTADGSTTATVKMLHRFTSQILLTVTSRADTDISVSCTIDAQTVIVDEIINFDNRYMPKNTEEISVSGYIKVYKIPLQFGDLASGYVNANGATGNILYGSINRDITYTVSPSSRILPTLTEEARTALSEAGLELTETVFGSGLSAVAERFYNYFDCTLTDDAKIEKLHQVFLQFQDKPFFEFVNTAKNGNGSYTEKIGITYNADTIKAQIASIELNEDNIIF